MFCSPEESLRGVRDEGYTVEERGSSDGVSGLMSVNSGSFAFIARLHFPCQCDYEAGIVVMGGCVAWWRMLTSAITDGLFSS